MASSGLRRDLAARRHRAEARRQGLAGEPLEVGLGVERLEVARPAVHEQEDDPLGLGREVGRPRGQRVGRSPRRASFAPGAARPVRPSPGRPPACRRKTPAVVIDRRPARRRRSGEAWARTSRVLRRLETSREPLARVAELGRAARRPCPSATGTGCTSCGSACPGSRARGRVLICPPPRPSITTGSCVASWLPVIMLEQYRIIELSSSVRSPSWIASSLLGDVGDLLR